MGDDPKLCLVRNLINQFMIQNLGPTKREKGGIGRKGKKKGKNDLNCPSLCKS